MTHPTLSDTQALVERAMMGTVDKGGHLASHHAKWVANEVLRLEGSEEAIHIAWLHDMVEDEFITQRELQQMGYSDIILSGVKLLTRENGQSYAEYISQLADSAHPEALLVKLADLTHNQDLSRLKTIQPQDLKRVTKRYRPAYTLLAQAYESTRQHQK